MAHIIYISEGIVTWSGARRQHARPKRRYTFRGAFWRFSRDFVFRFEAFCYERTEGNKSDPTRVTAFWETCCMIGVTGVEVRLLAPRLWRFEVSVWSVNISVSLHFRILVFSWPKLISKIARPLLLQPGRCARSCN